jgi:hypothetical protein
MKRKVTSLKDVESVVTDLRRHIPGIGRWIPPVLRDRGRSRLRAVQRGA